MSRCRIMSKHHHHHLYLHRRHRHRHHNHNIAIKPVKYTQLCLLSTEDEIMTFCGLCLFFNLKTFI